MPDIREVLAALDEEDKRLWQQHRTEMRRSYMAAHNSVLGIAAWDLHDDSFIDLIDIKLALLFDKSGRMNGTKTIVANEDGDKIEEAIIKEAAKVKTDLKYGQTAKPGISGNPINSDATKLMRAEWGTK